MEAPPAGVLLDRSQDQHLLRGDVAMERGGDGTRLGPPTQQRLDEALHRLGKGRGHRGGLGFIGDG
jgi:hypothetical protein